MERNTIIPIPDKKKETTLIIGIGNPILGDDGCGIFVVRMIKEFLKDYPELHVDVEEASGTALELIEKMEGYGRVILIDSIKTGNGDLGEIYRLNLDDLNRIENPLNLHLLDLKTAMNLGRKLGFDLPESISIYAIEILNNNTFGEVLTPKVREVLPDLIDQVLREIIA